MPLGKLFTTCVLGAAALSSGALASRSLHDYDYFGEYEGIVGAPPAGAPKDAKLPRETTSVRCKSSVGTYNENANNKARAEAAAEAAAYICGEGEADIEVVVNATATAFVSAVAAATAECTLEGDSQVFINGTAEAMNRAELWMKAYASATTRAISCDKCETFSESIAHIEREVFLNAVASASVQIDETNVEGETKTVSTEAYALAIEDAVVEAYAKSLANVRSVEESHECIAFGNATGCIETDEDSEPYCASCKSKAVSKGVIEEIDARVLVRKEGAALACGDDIDVNLAINVTARKLAEAYAEALSRTRSVCDIDEGGRGCTKGNSHTNSTAKAIAEGVTELIIDAANCKATCDLSVMGGGRLIKEALSEAASSAYSTVCTDLEGFWTQQEFEKEIVDNHIEAIANAVGSAFVPQDGRKCVGDLDFDLVFDNY